MTAVNPLPNILTTARLVSGVFMFLFLGAAVGIIPFVSENLTPDQQNLFALLAFWTFVVGAVSDFVDGWAARKFDAVTEWGAALDPIADKILITGAILGLISLGGQPHIAVPGALILFREFAVSALREATAGKGVKLAVTNLAKWKTTVQLTALGAQLFVYCWPAFGWDPDPAVLGPLRTFADTAMWVAAALTWWTGFDYFRAARRALPHGRP